MLYDIPMLKSILKQMKYLLYMLRLLFCNSTLFYILLITIYK